MQQQIGSFIIGIAAAVAKEQAFGIEASDSVAQQVA
jgi:hypothetical protein